jgi:spermidine synthase
VDVVEIEPNLVEWALAGVTPTLAAALADPRVRVHLGDIAELFSRPTGLAAELGPQRWDAIVLDVDNGPDFLIHPENRRLYNPDLLAAAVGRLTRGGLLAIWCSGPAPGLDAVLRRLEGRTEERRIEVVRGSRTLTYAIYAHWPVPG